MAVRRLAHDQPDDFSFTPENLEWAKAKIREYPEGRQASAVIPLLWRAQHQHGGWLPEPAIRLVADLLEMPYIRVLENATFYTMFQLAPVGTIAHIGVCGTTPCMLQGSEQIVAILKERIAAEPHTLSPDGRFSWEEVECAGACVNGPMVQIGPDTYEDLTPERFNAVLDSLERGDRPEPGPQSGRKASEPITGATTLTARIAATPLHASAANAVGGPDSDVDPTSPAAREQNAALPDPRDRADVEAMRQTPDGADDLVVAERADVAGQDAAAHRAAPGATFAQTPLKGPAEAEVVPRAAPHAQRARPAPEAPNSVAAERADKAGTRPEGFARGTLARIDDLRRIDGITATVERPLQDLGIFTFDQIAAWTGENVAWIEAYLGFQGRITHEEWVRQAEDLARKADGQNDAAG